VIVQAGLVQWRFIFIILDVDVSATTQQLAGGWNISIFRRPDQFLVLHFIVSSPLSSDL
jgi:hypothetical protein